MSHRILTCRNHPDLRWSCKDIAWTEGHGYNHSRHLFFNGTPKRNDDGSPKMYSDNSGLECTGAAECECPASALILAPEDALVARHP
jgi:hypothetical protein